MRNTSYRPRRTLIGVLAMGVALGYTIPASSFAAPVAPGTYVGGGTAVVKEDRRAPAADEGTVVCSLADGSGTGGACVPFGIDPVTGLPGDSVLVQDAAAGTAVAFQVCIDNNGDSVCTFPEGRDGTVGCTDQVFFSHNDAGAFFNPIGPLPTGFQPGCPGGPYPGYVVFLCEGAHNAGGAHAHAATTGRASLVKGGTGFGDFCGGVVENPTRKQYFVTGGSGAGNYVTGGTAVAKQSGQPPAADSGALACNAADGSGVGGACVPFGPGDSVLVNDTANGTGVAFQVCLDNDGDGVCTSPDVSQPCPDQIFFSHDDAGNFFNPLGPLPPSFLPGCPGGAWPGYVVFICQGAHVAGAASPISPIADASGHVHPATTGTASLTTGGTGFGTFCGGAKQAPSRKAYIVV